MLNKFIGLVKKHWKPLLFGFVLGAGGIANAMSKGKEYSDKAVSTVKGGIQ